MSKESTICWNCKNGGLCSWTSGEYIPVNNWVAEKVDYGKGEHSYIVKKCPLFEPLDCVKNNNENVLVRTRNTIIVRDRYKKIYTKIKEYCLCHTSSSEYCMNRYQDGKNDAYKDILRRMEKLEPKD